MAPHDQWQIQDLLKGGAQHVHFAESTSSSKGDTQCVFVWSTHGYLPRLGTHCRVRSSPLISSHR